MSHTRDALEQAAIDVIGLLKSIRQYSDAKVAIIGGLALWNYIRQGRSTQVVKPYPFKRFSYSDYRMLISLLISILHRRVLNSSF